MNRYLTGVLEWLAPRRFERESIPGFEGGLRPNQRLDEARAVDGTPAVPEDAVFLGEELLVSSPEGVTWTARGETSELGGACGALAATTAGVVVAVDGVGLVELRRDGSHTVVCDDEIVAHHVTDLAVDQDGCVWVAVGSAIYTPDEWVLGLVSEDASGMLVRVDAGRATTMLHGLSWLSGIEAVAGGVLMSLSFAHAIVRTTGRIGSGPELVLGPLPGFPGRIRAHGGRLVATVPYPRNRLSEMILGDDEVKRDMIASLTPDTWLVPVLQTPHPVRDPLQLGQLRVHGNAKPWAPARSYGLAIEFTMEGRILQSWHSRYGGRRHGITGVGVGDGRAAFVSRAAREVVEVTL